MNLSLCFTKHHATKMYWGSGGIAPHILNLGTGWRWLVSLTPQPFYPWDKSVRFLLNRRLGGPQNQSGCRDEEKNFHHFFPCRELSRDSPARSLVTILTELPGSRSKYEHAGRYKTKSGSRTRKVNATTRVCHYLQTVSTRTMTCVHVT
jgi:hypothetical protein